MRGDSIEVIVCGAGIAGIAAAYQLSRHKSGRILLVDERPPFSLTSDKSTECYRNWWAGPDAAMVQLMDRSIDLLEELADETGNIFHMNRRGYLYLTSDPHHIEAMRSAAIATSALGAGPIREHTGASPGSDYGVAKADGFHGSPVGADWITDTDLLHRCFPGLSPSVVAGLHVRRAGWMSGQQLASVLLERARLDGVELRIGRVAEVRQARGRVTGVRLESKSGVEDVPVRAFVDAAGPFVNEVARLLDDELPIYHELHAKVAFADSLGIVDRASPLLVWDDAQRLAWTAEEGQALADSVEGGALLGRLPSGLHIRPEGGAESPTVLALWPYHTPRVEARFPIAPDAAYAEVVLRGLESMLPGMCAYRQRPPRPYVDGGYYTRTVENRPLIGPLSVDGGFVLGALSGFGLMAAMASGELLAAHILGMRLPEYAAAFHPQRFADPGYLARWQAPQTNGQL